MSGVFLFIGSLLAATAALVSVIVAGPLVATIATAVRAMDYPGGRRVQREAIPRLGGIAIAIGIAAGAALPFVLLAKRFVLNVTPGQLFALVLGSILVFTIGVAEDVVGVTPAKRFLYQVAAVGVVSAGWSLTHLYAPVWGEVELGLWGSLATVSWIVGVTNAINLLDGLAGVAAIIAMGVLIIAWIQETL